MLEKFRIIGFLFLAEFGPGLTEVIF